LILHRIICAIVMPPVGYSPRMSRMRESPCTFDPRRHRSLQMQHLTEPEPLRGAATEVGPGIRRIVAANPGPMTYHGTNTWLVEEPDGITVIDPGPDDPAHLDAVVAAGGGRITRILLSHSHADHLGNLAALRRATGAPVWALAPEAAPDVVPAEGDAIGGLTVLHTPGH